MNNYKKDIKNNRISKINFFIKENNHILKIKGTIKRKKLKKIKKFNKIIKK